LLGSVCFCLDPFRGDGSLPEFPHRGVKPVPTSLSE